MQFVAVLWLPQTSPEGNGVILVGGQSSSGYLDSILELKTNDQGWVGAWTTLSTKLQYARRFHIIIPVLMNKNICRLQCKCLDPTNE